jgi:uncharacterized protein
MKLTAPEVLRRYKDEELPEFCEIRLDDVNQIGNFGDRPLHVACLRGNLEEVEALIRGGAAVNATGEFDNTPLHQAVQQGHGAIVKFLLEHGASTDAKNALGQTPVDVATLARRYEILRILLSPTSGHA